MKRILLILCLLGLFPMISMPAQEAKEPVPTFSREHFEIEGHKAFVILPATERTNRGKSIPWVFYAPTFDGKLPSDRDEGWMMQRWLDKGIAIAGVDVGESYGSPDGRSIYDALHKTLVDKYRFDHKACLLARSRGGLMLYCWAVENPEKVRCIAGIYPVCDLTSYPGISKACAAYGMTKAELEASLDQHNPIPRLAALAKAQVPIFHIHGDKDKVVPLEANSAALQKVYQKLGGSIQLVIAPDQWHNMWRGFFECLELVDFVITKAIGV
ncbi:prolyl oligopeptidase family serine peptidase [Verrucomicrobia bacterium]|nr:prolyl oligopeptidase family serine peptidase [Verrucomicrobiota bacterium]